MQTEHNDALHHPDRWQEGCRLPAAEPPGRGDQRATSFSHLRTRSKGTVWNSPMNLASPRPRVLPSHTNPAFEDWGLQTPGCIEAQTQPPGRDPAAR